MSVPTMDPETQKQWDSWARAIAFKQCQILLGAIVDKYEPRVLELEREIVRLKAQQPAPSEEWPLRSITGGKR